MFQRGRASRGAEVTTTTRDDGIPTEFKALESWVSLKDLGRAVLSPSPAILLAKTAPLAVPWTSSP